MGGRVGLVSALLLGLLGLAPAAAFAGQVYNATPANYRSFPGRLRAGDTLNLAAGTYKGQLALNGLKGTEAAWITVQGPASGAPAVFEANSSENTVQIHGSCYVAIKYLTLDGKGLDGPDGIKAGGGGGSPTHHILVEGCTIKDYDGSQQCVGISTKSPTWGWVIRGNRIIRAGTGLYLGNSDGTCPFVAGIIEGNLVKDTVGYNMEIKWQKPRPDVAGMPAEASKTIVRHNVFIKSDRPSPDGNRPNLLVGGFPDSGPGSSDMYEVYGNFFFHNPREALFQASGRVSIHDNVFVDVAGTAIVLQNHDRPLKLFRVYNNTIYGAGTGISCGGAKEGGAVVGNLILAGRAISGSPAVKKDNLIDTTANAGNWVKKPSKTLGEMDFNGASKGEFKFAGAYAGDAANAGWAPKDGLKTLGAQPGPVVVKPEPRPEPKPEPKPVPKTPSPTPAPPPPVERTPDQICQSWFATANNYAKAGLNEKAAEYFKKIIETYPTSDWAGKARAELKKL